MRRLLLALASLTLVVLPAAQTHAQQAHYRVVGMGDSILHLVRAAGGINGPDRLWDTEQGRDAYTPGNMNRDSMLSAWPDVLRASQPGGWVVIQDNGHGVTDDRWRTLMNLFVRQLPDTRCLLGIFPAYDADVSPAAALNARVKATIMAQEFSVQPCVAFIYWNYAVRDYPWFVYDGQHPSLDGIDWLTDDINRIVNR